LQFVIDPQGCAVIESTHANDLSVDDQFTFDASLTHQAIGLDVAGLIPLCTKQGIYKSLNQRALTRAVGAADDSQAQLEHNQLSFLETSEVGSSGEQ
jgi:hypothetical protein